MQPTPTTQNLIADDRTYLWHPFTPMKPWCEDKNILIIESAQNEFLIDTNGNRYLDAVSSLWCNIHGHNLPELNQAITTQLQKVAHTTLLGLANIPSIQLAKRLIQLAQSSGLNLTKVFYSDNGSTAVEVAAKMAHQYWRNLYKAGDGIAGPRGTAALGCDAPQEPAPYRSRFIAFQSAYHGDTLGAVSLGGIPLFHQTFKSLTFPVDFIPPPSHIPAQIQTTLNALENLLTQKPTTYAAIILEPLVLGAGGMLMYPPQVLTQIRQLATTHNTLLIADEVMTGFGRTGKMFASEHAPIPQSAIGNPQSAITPDLLCLSKGLTAGYLPLGATLTTQKIFDAFYVDPNANHGENITKTFFHGHTFTGNPLACAVALASLDLFDKNHLLDHVHQLMPILHETLEKARQNPYVADARQCGLIGAIDLAHPASHKPFPYHWRIGGALCTRLRSLNILARPLADTLILMPPLAITEKNFRQLCDAILQSLTWLPEIVASASRR